ncbi:glutamic acid-rich protein-like [Mercenaria mercenaria]|uniref:glutamic acid-rich protein-like n=1 Tax=Mercenaria mercenaria TaxID=6596 RepID=UPI00234FAC5C|nr:glutamic acid-rich protein-like [Mercenaria mercenaria]
MFSDTGSEPVCSHLQIFFYHLGGQAVATRLSKQLKQTNKKIKGHLVEYNELGGHQTGLPVKLHFNDVKDTDAAIWTGLQLHATSDAVPHRVQQQAVQYYSMVKRALEEQEMLKQEMHSTIGWYHFQHNSLLEMIQTASKVECAFLVKEGLHTEMMLKVLSLSYQPFIDIQFEEHSEFSSMVGMTKVDEITYSDFKEEVAEYISEISYNMSENKDDEEEEEEDEDDEEEEEEDDEAEKDDDQDEDMEYGGGSSDD